MAAAAKRAQLQRPGATLLATVDEAVADMSWLRPSDAGMVALAREYAAMIERDATSIGRVGPYLANVLRSLGGAPAERKALGVEEVVGGRLAELRSARKRNAKAVDSSAS